MTSSSIPFTKLSSLSSYSKTSPSRLQALYADISRQKTSNPTAFQSNVSWWRATLDAIVSNGWQPSTPDKFVLKADRSLPESLRYEGTGKPLCLATVVAELSESRTLIPLSHFLSSPQSIYDPGWLPYRIASYLVGKPLWWTLQQLNIVGSDEAGHESDTQRWKKVNGEYVFVDLVERAAENVLAKQDKRTGVSLAESLYSFEGFKEEFGSMALPGVTLSDTDVKVLVKYLQRDKRVLIADKEVVKFVDLGATAEPPEISAVDRGVLELKNAVANLDAQIANIQSKIDGCTEKATAALRQKRKELALSYVRSRKQLEDVLKRRLGSLETLQSTLLRVEAAAGDIEIMKSYETSATTLRSILTHPSLQRDSIDNTLEALSAATADAREVDDAIRLGGEMAVAEAGYEVGEEELEAELRALVEEGEREKIERVETEKVMEKQMEREKEAEKDKTGMEEREEVREKEDRACFIFVPLVESALKLERGAVACTTPPSHALDAIEISKNAGASRTRPPAAKELYNNLPNPTADSIATWCGITGINESGDSAVADLGARFILKLFNGHMGYLQRKPRDYQTRVHSEFCAKYLPRATEIWRNDYRAYSPSMMAINTFVFTPYFVRFTRTPSGAGMAPLLASRIADLDPSTESDLDIDAIGELVQFLSTLMVLQGTQDINAEDKEKVKTKCKAWMRKYRGTGRVAENGSDRCLKMLNAPGGAITGDFARMKDLLNDMVDKCGRENCNVRKNAGEPGNLSQCARCKTTVYCSAAHQKQHWPTHKKLCIPPSF